MATECGGRESSAQFGRWHARLCGPAEVTSPGAERVESRAKRLRDPIKRLGKCSLGFERPRERPL